MFSWRTIRYCCLKGSFAMVKLSICWISVFSLSLLLRKRTTSSNCLIWGQDTVGYSVVDKALQEKVLTPQVDTDTILRHRLGVHLHHLVRQPFLPERVDELLDVVVEEHVVQQRQYL